MARGRKPVVGTASAAATTRPRSRGGRANLIDAVFWDVIAVNSHIEEISFGWAQLLGVSSHQWLVLMAIHDLDGGDGVSVRHVSAKLHCDPSIVTAQSKGLEKDGWLTRVTSPDDARVVLMALTAKSAEEIAGIKSRREELKRSIFEDLDDSALSLLHTTLEGLTEKFLRAERRLFAEL